MAGIFKIFIIFLSYVKNVKVFSYHLMIKTALWAPFFIANFPKPEPNGYVSHTVAKRAKSHDVCSLNSSLSISFCSSLFSFQYPISWSFSRGSERGTNDEEWIFCCFALFAVSLSIEAACTEKEVSTKLSLSLFSSPLAYDEWKGKRQTKRRVQKDPFKSLIFCTYFINNGQKNQLIYAKIYKTWPRCDA